MSNPNKEWLNDRANEAWEDLTKIAEAYECFDELYEDWQKDFTIKVLDILEEGGWIQNGTYR